MIGPYAVAALDYLAAGWSPIPIRRDTKAPLCKGCTGYEGSDPEAPQVEEWVRKYPSANIAVRLPRGVLGIDIDAYEAKQGLETLRRLVDLTGEALPPTWISTARPEPSGIALFRVEDSNLFRDPGAGIEVIRQGHRFAMCPPSRHPTAAGHPPYVWLKPNGRTASHRIPSPEELPRLPSAWVSRLPMSTGSPRPRLAQSIPPNAWVGASNDPWGKRCEGMAQTLRLWLERVKVAGVVGGAHPAATDGVWALIGDAAAGHTGVGKALVKLGRAYERAVAGRRPGGAATARGEFARAVEGATAKTPARFAAECVCTDDLWKGTR